jgi:hypothetical protein
MGFIEQTLGLQVLPMCSAAPMARRDHAQHDVEQSSADVLSFGELASSIHARAVSRYR